MTLWAIADLHLSFGTPDKKMDIFGENWKDHAEKVEKSWRQVVDSKDLVLLAGDFSWAMTSLQVKPDFDWLDSLPGTKVMIKGNHDYWWQSIGKVRKELPPSCHVIQNDCFVWGESAIAGTRLWDTPEFNFGESQLSEEDEKIFLRELQRLEMSLKAMPQDAKVKIAMTHYPPVGLDMQPTRVTHLLEKYGVTLCLFGHLHHLQSGEKLFGELNGVRYQLTACDFLNFQPLQISQS